MPLCCSLIVPATPELDDGSGWCNVRDMGGLVASVVVIAILLGVLLVVVFDVFCLLHLWAADTTHFLPKFVWAVLIVCTSPIGGLVYLLAQRLPKRSPEPVTMRTRNLLERKAWFGPGLMPSPAAPWGHAVGVVAISAAVYLVIADQVLAAGVVMVALVTIVFLKATSPSGAARAGEIAGLVLPAAFVLSMFLVMTTHL
jgi:hypothetical protein